MSRHFYLSGCVLLCGILSAVAGRPFSRPLSPPPSALVVNTESLLFDTFKDPVTLPVRIGSTTGPIAFRAGVTGISLAQVGWLRLSATLTGSGSISITGVAPTIIYATANPAGLAAGEHKARINIFWGDTAVSIDVTLRKRSGGVGGTLSDDRLAFYYVLNGPPPAPKDVSVVPVGALNKTVAASAQVNQPSGGNWLQVTPAAATAPVKLTVSVNPAGLAPDTYTGTVSVVVDNSPADSRVVGIILVVRAAAHAHLGFEFQAGQAVPPPQTVDIASPDAAAFTYVADISPEGGTWLSADPASAKLDPGMLNPAAIYVDPAGLSPGRYRGACAFADPAEPRRVVIVFVTLTVTTMGVTPPPAETRHVISHIADGQQWKTSIILVNLDSAPAQFRVNFWRDDGRAFAIPLAGAGSRESVEDTIPVGGSRTIESEGTGAELIGGWAEVLSARNISGTAIFRARNIGQEAAVPLVTAENTRLLLPFDTSSELALGVGLANASATRDGSSSISWCNQQGQAIANQPMPLGAHAHRAFVLANPSSRPGDQRGVLEFNSSNGIYALGIRSRGDAFTSIESIGPQAQGTKTISHVADGAKWKTTIMLVNADTIPALFRLEFWNQDGSPMAVSITGRGNVSNVTDTIPVGGSRTIETDGSAAALSQGWAQVVTQQAIGGTAIFRATDIGQEAAVPLLASGSSRLLIPFDTSTGLALGIAIANPNPAFPAGVNVAIRNQQGVSISTNRVEVPRHGHVSFVLANPSSHPLDQRGVVELSSTGGPIFALGIRSNLSAFTSIRALGN